MSNPHTCRGEPDKRGRITSSCQACHWTAHCEGAYLGTTHAARKAERLIKEAIARKYNPLDQAEEKKALRNWRTVQEFNALIEEALRPITEEAGAEFDRSKEAHRSPIPGEEESQPATLQEKT